MGKRNSAWRDLPKSKVRRYRAAGAQRKVWAGEVGGDKLDLQAESLCQIPRAEGSQRRLRSSRVTWVEMGFRKNYSSNGTRMDKTRKIRAKRLSQ